MAIENRTKDYTSHKYKRTVYVDLNPKTKVGSDLIGQYKQQTHLHCMDLGRIGYHDEHGKYKIDYYTTKELIVIPKLIIRVTERAMSRAGRDVYELRTYMSKFGQLNFLLVVDKDYADLILVENVYIENLNHRENYETLLWRLSYYNQKPLPLAEIFYKYGIKANPDDYGKSWKEDDIKINNVLAAKSKAMMTVAMANKVGSAISQKALVASLNNLNKEGNFGRKITEAYSVKVAKNAEINKLATSPKLENTLNHVLIKTLEEQTTKKDLADPVNLRVYKRVIDVQLSTPSAVAEEVEKLNTKQNFKNFLMENYQKPQSKTGKHTDEIALFDEKQDQFEKIIAHRFSRATINEKTEKREEKLDVSKTSNVTLPKEFVDFEGNKVMVDLTTDRFYAKEDAKHKKEREQKEKELLREQKRAEKEVSKAKRRLRRVNAKCDIEAEFERSKTLVGLTPDYDRPRKKIKALFERKEKSRLSRRQKIEAILNNREEEKTTSEQLLDKMQKKIKRQSAKETIKKQLKDHKEQEKARKKQIKLQEKEEKKKKKTMLSTMVDEKKEKKKRQTVDMAMLEAKEKSHKKHNKEQQNSQTTRPVVKPMVESNNKQTHKQKEVPAQNSSLGEANKQEILQHLTRKIQQQEVSQEGVGIQKNNSGVGMSTLTNNNQKPRQEQTHFDISQNRHIKKEKTLEM